MPTLVTSSIGSNARAYSTLAGWIAACPSNLVSDDKTWRGEMYNDSDSFTSNNGNLLTISGITTDATRRIELTAAAGQSFQDHANVRTNPLYYDQTKGVGIRNTSDADYGSSLIIISSDYVQISRLQFWLGIGAAARMTIGEGGGTSWLLKDCIVSGGGSMSGRLFNGTVINCLFLSTRAYCYSIFPKDTTFIGCTFAKRHDLTPVTECFFVSYPGTWLMQSCAIFNYTGIASSAPTWDGASRDNATDLSSGLPTTGAHHSVTFSATTPFVQAGSSGTDFRAIASTTLAAAGYLDATNAPNDISATARAASPTIGAWELASAGVTLALSGVAGTCAAGLLGVALSIGLTGAVATAAVGTVTTNSAALSGVAGTGSAGSLTPARTVALTGVSATGAAGSVSVPIPVTDANFYCSPINTYSDGGGALAASNVKAGSTYVQWNTPGGWVRTNFSGTSIKLKVDVSMRSGEAETDYPVIAYSIDGAAPTRYQCLSSDTTITLATGLTNTVHSLRVIYDAGTESDDLELWIPTLLNILRVTGVVLDGGAVLSAPTLHANIFLAYGDSVTCGFKSIDDTTGFATDSSAEPAYSTLVAEALSCQAAIVGYPATGYTAAASAPGLISAYDLYYQGQSRLDGGLFSPQPKYISVNDGINGTTTSGNVVTILTSLRAAAPLAKLLVIVPHTGAAAAALAAGVTSFGDANTQLIDTGVTSYDKTDTFHLSIAGHLAYAIDILAQLPTVLTGVSGTGSVGTVTQSRTVALTGVSATGAAGTVAPSRTAALTGTAGTGAAGSLVQSASVGVSGVAGTSAAGTVAPSLTVATTGVSASGAAGTVTATATLGLTGTQGTGSVGTVTPSGGDGGNVSLAVTGVAATGAAGTVTPSRTVALGGAAGTGAVGTVGAGSDVSAALSGVAGTGAAGSVTPSRTVALTGTPATGGAGTVAGADTTAATGVSGTGAVGAVTQSRTVALTGVAGTGAVGAVGAGAPGQSSLTGVVGTGAAGTVAVVSSSTVGLTGVSSAGSVGTLASSRTRAVTGVAGTGAVGTVTASGSGSAVLTGVAAAGAVGTLTPISSSTLALTGVSATGAAGTMVAIIGVVPGDLVTTTFQIRRLVEMTVDR